MGKPLELIDGAELLPMILEVRKEPTTADHVSNDVLRPFCSGSKMVLRTAKRGNHAGEQFWGCSVFPNCRGTKPYTGQRPTKTTGNGRVDRALFFVTIHYIIT